MEVGGSFIGHFCGRHKWVTSKTIISKKANVWNRNASDIPEILILNFDIATNIRKPSPPSGIYFLKANNGNTRATCGICSKLTTIKNARTRSIK